MAQYWINYRGVSSHVSGKKLRLDPCHLPQHLYYKGQKSGKYFSAFLTERGVFIQEDNKEHSFAPEYAQQELTLLSGCHSPKETQNSVFKILSPQQFRGLAACKITIPHPSSAEKQKKAFCLILLHEKADYSVPLLISTSKDDVLLDWRLWADIYNLPMLISEESGVFRPLGSTATLKLFINDHKIPIKQREFSLRCYGLSLNTRLVLANQVMLG